jgi:hypothetical protein
MEILIFHKSFELLSNLRKTDTYYIHEEIRNRLNSRHACYHLVQNRVNLRHPITVNPDRKLKNVVHS